MIRELRYKLEKYTFHKIDVGFLRFLISQERIEIDPEKIQIILK